MTSTAQNVATTAAGNLIQLGDGVYLCKPVTSADASDATRSHDSNEDIAGDANESEDPATAKEGQEQEIVTTSRDTVPPPDIIFLFTWMGAKLPHILKYAQAYNGLYPTATIIIVRSDAKFFWSTIKARESYLKPVVQTLELLGCLPAPPNEGNSKTTTTKPTTTLLPLVEAANVSQVMDKPTPRVIAHTFSNGGAWQLTTLSALLSKTYLPTSFPFSSESESSEFPGRPASAVILDSCPGNGDADRTVAAFSSAIRSPILRLVVSLAIRGLFFSVSLQSQLSTVLYSLRSFVRCLLSRKSSTTQPETPPKPDTTIDIMKRTLSSPHLLPWFSITTPRLYIYSSTDKMIPSEEVEAHASEAEKTGLSVRRENFEESGHVAHARVDPGRYWAAVERVWGEVAAAGGR